MIPVTITIEVEVDIDSPESALAYARDVAYAMTSHAEDRFGLVRVAEWFEEPNAPIHP